MLYIGIDPGRSGGIASISSNGVINLISMPDEFDALAILKSMSTGKCTAAIEKVQGYAGSPTVGSQMFNFGWNYGSLRMASHAAGIPFEDVMPSVWMRSSGIPPRGKTETKTQFKNRIKAKAQQLYPNEKITLKTCDALLLATYCMRKYKGTL